MHRSFFLLIVLCIMNFMANAQAIWRIRSVDDFFDAYRMDRANRAVELDRGDVEGSPYMNSEFIKGAVYTSSKVKFEKVPLRYNLYNENVEFCLDGNNVQVFATPEIIKKVEIDKVVLEYIPFIDLKKIKKGFLFVIEKGEASLYSRSRVIFKEATEPQAYKESKPSRFVSVPDEYYIRIEKRPAYRIDKKKDIVKIFPKHKRKITEFVKKNRIKVKKKESLKELVVFYNSIN